MKLPRMYGRGGESLGQSEAVLLMCLSTGISLRKREKRDAQGGSGVPWSVVNGRGETHISSGRDGQLANFSGGFCAGIENASG
jgi:hypothetical protein